MSLAVPPRVRRRTWPPLDRRPSPPPASPPARRRAPGGGATGPATLALFGLSAAAAVDLARLFKSMGRFLGPVVVTTAAVHAVCWVCRRRGRGLAVATVASALATGTMLAWTVLPHTTTFGVPTRETLSAARAAMSAAMNTFHTVSPPAPAVPGFVLAGGLGCAGVAFVADWLAFRLRATTEACLPSLSLFVFSSALAQGHRTSLAAAVWLAALLTFLLVREAGLERPSIAWFAGHAGRGPVALLRAGAVLGILSVALAVSIGPELPGATTHALISWRHAGTTGPGRTTASPLVDIRARLFNQSNVEVFSVATTTPSYWRLTSLDHFDGSGWSLNDEYHHSGGALAPPTPGGPTVTARFAITGLQSIWLPAAFRPVQYRGPRRVSYSPGADSLIVDKATSDGLTYVVQSSVPAPSIAAMSASPPVRDPSLSGDLVVPALPPIVEETASLATAGAANAFDRAKRLQDYFRSPLFTYDASVSPDDGGNAIVNFLTSRKGFCQQFAGTYAVMARLLGLPARVAVGFTPGDQGLDGRYHVLNRHAHAWPEVFFAGIGWVSFEPTPGRGDPNTTPYTQVKAEQARPGEAFPGSTTSVVAPTPPVTAPARNRAPADQGGSLGRSGRHRSPLRTIGIVVLWGGPLALVALTPLVHAMRRSRRRAATHDAAGRVLLAWNESRDDLAAVGASIRRSDTPREYAQRTVQRSDLPHEAATALLDLAECVVEVSYAPGEVSTDHVARAEAGRAVIGSKVAERQSRWQRIWRSVDPRTLRRQPTR